MKTQFVHNRNKIRIFCIIILFCVTASSYGQTGNTLSNPVIAGSYGATFSYSNSQNTGNFSHNYGSRSYNTSDVYYRFTLSRKMLVTMTHCGSAIDTYMYLLDANGNQITCNDDYSADGACSSTLHSFIQRPLEAGTYYVVSEGYSISGNITTNITGNADDEFEYPEIPDSYSSDPEAVGSTGGSLNVSSTGGAVYSIPIEIPPGINGMQPSLAIVYNSQSGNGIAGWGAYLSGLPAITRAPKDIYHDGAAKALSHSADEAYYLDGQRLIYQSGTAGQEGAIYCPESDPFTKVTVHGTYNSATANTWFEVQSSNGMKYYYGNTASGRQSYSINGSPRIHAWYVDYAVDPAGNYMTYAYNNYSYSMYPAVITYGTNSYESTGFQNTVTFGYEYRANDAQPFVVEETVTGSLSYRLKSITSKTGNNIYRTYDLQYDITGDGSGAKFSRLTSVTEKNGAGEALKPVKFNWSFLPSFSQTYQTPSISSTYVPLGVYGNNVSFYDQSYAAADLNGDGLDDLIGVFPYANYSYYANSSNNRSSPTNIAFVNFASLNSSGNVEFTTSRWYNIGGEFSMKDWMVQKGGASAIDFDGDGINELLVPEVDINEYWKDVYFSFFSNTLEASFGYSLKYSSEMPVYGAGDFNNNGKGDIIFIEKGQSGNKYPCQIVELNSGTSLNRISLNLTLPAKPEKLFVSDFNRDGLQDIMLFHTAGYTIFWNQGNGLSGTTFSDSKKYNGNSFNNVKTVKLGDFNGDGLPDFLMNQTNDYNWYIELNKGNGAFTKNVACRLYAYDQSYTDEQYNGHDDDKLNCQIFDFDMDGKSDVVITKAMFSNTGWFLDHWIKFDKTYTHWMRSTGSTLVEVKKATSNREDDGQARRYVLGDFNGDGQPELINFGYNCYSSTDASNEPTWKLYRNSGFTVDKGKVASIIDSYGSTTSISYASLAGGGVYTKGAGSAYPVADCSPPVHVVKTVIANNGAAGSMTTNYRYGGLKMHLQGKGMLGMASQTASNTTLGIVSESGVKSWNTAFYVPSATYSKTTVGGKTTETNTTLTIMDKGSKKYFAFPSSQTDKDLDGNTVTTTRQFNTTYGYITEEKADFGGNMYKTVQYGNYTSAGRYYKPQLITRIQKHSDDASTFTQKTYIAYDATKGYQTQVIENYGSSLPLTTNYTYDTFGNVKTSTTSGSGVSTLTTGYDYDATKRFVAKTYTSPASSVMSFSYDTFGNVLTEKDETNPSNILTTTHTYDRWGSRKSTILPDGNKTAYCTGWNNNLSKRYFTLTQGTGRPWIKTWYDSKGREVATETPVPKSISIRQTTIYNSKGQISQKQTLQGNLILSESYTYDGRGRLASQTNSAGQNSTYKYGIRRDTTITNGRTYVKTYDAWGNVKTSTDPVSTISYAYNSLGKPKSITAGGAVFSMTYYDTGNQKTLTDPNAGTTTFTYDAAGRITQQTDARGKRTVNTYDALGRNLTSTIDGIATAYTYGTSGNDILQLIKIQTGNNRITYGYDRYGRVIMEKRYIENSDSLQFAYQYNTRGQLSAIIYPDNIEIDRYYDAYGNLQKVTRGRVAIWELTGETGTVTTAQLGTMLTATRTRNAQGLLTNIKTVKGSTILHNMDYQFNGATGNLTSRTGMTGQTETFVYDNADRLTAVRHNGTAVMDIAYSPNGNIQSKTGLGAYSYDYRPHAVDFVENTGELISYEDQQITHTAFNKVASISEKVGANQYTHDISYGPDRQRWKSTLKKNGLLQRTILYAGDYERIIEGSNTKSLIYIQGGDGLVAVNVAETGQAFSIYHVHTDHLGSIVKLTDSQGAEVFRASYDAWGNRTVTNNTFAFHRGYTGHEHLAEFGLINMNGRVYDPILGRFLSPDPFVQVPGYSQSFNRYAYCLNNPFKYTDQTGEFWHIVIGALVGGVINLVVNWNNIDNFWEGLAIVGVGIAGGAITAATCGTDGGEGVLWAMATGAAISATNDIVRQTNDEIGLKDVDWGQVGISAGIGTVSGAASFGAGTWAANNLGGIVINGTNITSPVLTGTIKGTIGGAAGGYAGNFTSTLLLTGDVKLAHKMGLQGMAVGSVIGGSSGAANSYLDAKLNNLNPWTGKSNIKITSDDLGISFTMDRIMDGQTYPYRNDGSIFQNRENILPVQDAGYYKEYVHPTSGVSGPGAQRIIIGRGGEYYYSPDHYKTFIRFRH